MAIAGPTEDANAVVDLWSATYSANDTEKIALLYTSDGILLGTVSPIISVGTEAIQKYFTPLKGSGNKNTIQERHTIVLDDAAVLVTGFYEFVSLVDGKPTPRPSRFTMLLTKREGQWRIAHHHSSPRVLPKT
jgi:uncharacterized protein (TIGR02246 family)